MGKTVSIGGITVHIEAVPDTLQEPDKRGRLQVGEVEAIYENFSCISGSISFMSVYSDDPQVASVIVVTSTSSFHIPSRPNRRTAWPPAKGRGMIAHWEGVSPGTTNVTAAFEIATKGFLVGFLQPTTGLTVVEDPAKIANGKKIN
jgi:hypothetical protein